MFEKHCKLIGPALALVTALACASGGTAQAQQARDKPPPQIRSVQKRWLVSPPGFDSVFDGKALTAIRVARGYLGVQLTEITPELRSHFGAPVDAGVLVNKLDNDGPGAKAGVKVGDVITAVDGKKTGSPWDMRQAVRDKKEGDTVAIEVWRNRAKQTLKATVARREVPAVSVLELFENDGDRARLFEMELPRLRMSVEKALGPDWRQRVERQQELEQKLEKRTKELEDRIQDLEKRMGGGKGRSPS